MDRRTLLGAFGVTLISATAATASAFADRDSTMDEDRDESLQDGDGPEAAKDQPKDENHESEDAKDEKEGTPDDGSGD